MAGEKITAFKVPQLYRHFKGNTYVVLNDSVVDATKRYSHLEDSRRMVLYTDGITVFVRAYDEFFGIDEKSGQQRFVRQDEGSLPVEEESVAVLIGSCESGMKKAPVGKEPRC